MIKGGKGGGNTNKHGLRAETIIYDKFLKNFNNIENFISNYSKNSSNIIIGKKNDIYKHKDSGLIYDQNLIDSINYKPQPDIYIYNPKNKKLWIIEIKNQDIAGTGWEKMEFGIYGYKNDTYKRILKI